MIRQDQLPMVAIPSMNDTHLEEMLIINRLYGAVQEGNVEAVASLLEELLSHTTEHFASEERMMQETNFPAYNPHKSEHDRHISELKSLISYFDKNKDTKAIYAYVEGNLKSWVVHHIETMDTVTAQFVQEHNKA